LYQYQIRPKDKNYIFRWCGCGWSHSQPFCDTTCKHFAYKAVISGGGPLTYIAPGKTASNIYFDMKVKTSSSVLKRIKMFGFATASAQNDALFVTEPTVTRKFKKKI